METDIVILAVDDWTACYFNGECIDQGHSLDIPDILDKLVGKTVKSMQRAYFETDDDLAPYGNRFPQKLSDFKEFSN